jgi:starvation-inducible outer membrane lipoprotein
MNTKLITTLTLAITLSACAVVPVDCRGVDPAECQQRQYAEQSANLGFAAMIGGLIGYALGHSSRGYSGYRGSSRGSTHYGSRRGR